MNKRYYILIGIFSYLFFTLGNMPAAKLISMAEKNSAMPVKLYGVHGSVWSGGADKAIVKGQPPIDNLQWSINPAFLLLAQLSGEVKASVKQQNIIGNISIGPSGSIQASDIRARITAAVVQEFIQLPLGELGGVFNMDIDTFEFNQGSLPVINGTLNWKNAKLTLLETVDLGNIKLNVSPGENNQLIATIKNRQGQLKLDGNANVDEKKMYSINLRITPEENASDNTRQSLKMFARRQADGSYQLKRKGNLQEFGI